MVSDFTLKATVMNYFNTPKMFIYMSKLSKIGWIKPNCLKIVKIGVEILEFLDKKTLFRIAIAICILHFSSVLLKSANKGYNQCDFETDLCDWTQATATDDFDWTRFNGATPSVDTGPSRDHTTGTSEGKRFNRFSYLISIDWAYNRVLFECMFFLKPTTILIWWNMSR